MLKLFVAAAFAALLAAPAQALQTFDWSFQNVEGAVAGEVSGFVVLPDGEGTFPAIEFVVEKVPPAVEASLAALVTPPIVLSDYDDVFRNAFTVVGGEIDASQSAFVGTLSLFTAIALRNPFDRGARSSFVDLRDARDFGLTGVRDADSATLRFSRRTSDVPLPLPAALLLTGLGAVVVAARRKAA